MCCTLSLARSSPRTNRLRCPLKWHLLRDSFLDHPTDFYPLTLRCTFSSQPLLLLDSKLHLFVYWWTLPPARELHEETLPVYCRIPTCFWHFTSPQQTPTEKMNTVTKHPKVPTRQAYGQPTLLTQELGLRERVTRSGPWAVWVWLQMGWAKQSSGLPLGMGGQSGGPCFLQSRGMS